MDTVLWFLKQGIFAKRNPAMQQREKTVYGDMRACDIVASTCYGPIFVQAKYKEKYFTKAEEKGLEALAKRFNGESMLTWRDNGIQFRMLYVRPRT